jgi:hypothetical protein
MKKVNKTPIDPKRIRKIPSDGFSWIDRRFVRDRFIEELPPEAILLYFFLVAVSDAKGLSFYADPTISRILKIDAGQLIGARDQLVRADLILYQYPLYQILPLPDRVQRSATRFTRKEKSQSSGDFLSIADIFKAAEERAKTGSEKNEGRL